MSSPENANQCLWIAVQASIGAAKRPGNADQLIHKVGPVRREASHHLA